MTRVERVCFLLFVTVILLVLTAGWYFGGGRS